MDYNEFANKIKEKYPDYSDMDNASLTRAMMSKFPEYSDIDTSSMDKQATQNTGYDYSSQEEYDDLYNNARQVGYSGLDSAQKDLFNKAYSKSLYAQNGKTLKEAQDETDARAMVSPDIANNIGTWIRKPLAPLVADVGGIFGGIKSAYNAPDNKLGAFVSGMKNSAADTYKNAIAGKGLAGIAADPTNAIMFVPGIGELNLLSKAGSLAKYPYIGSALTQGLIGLGSTTTSEALNPSEKVTVPSVITGGILGGLSGAGSKLISAVGTKSFPNVERIINDEKDIYLTPTELESHMSNVSFPYTMGSQKAAADNWIDEAGKQFNEAVKEIPLSRTGKDINTTNLVDDMNMLRAAGFDENDAKYYALSNAVNPRTIFPTVEQDRLGQLIEAKRLSDGRGGYITKTNNEDLGRAITKRLNDVRNKMGDQISLNAPVEDFSGMIGNTSPINIPTDLANGLVPKIDISDLSKLRQAYASQYKPNADVDERVANYADELMHDAIVKRMENIPEYKKIIDVPLSSGFGAKKQYGLAKDIRGFVSQKAPVPTDWRRWIPILNNYAAPTAMYKAGKTSGPAFVVNTLDRLVEQYWQERNNKK